MTHRGDYARLSDFELAVKQLLTSAEVARLEGEALHRHGFAPVGVVGSDRLLWERDGTLFTAEAALTTFWRIEEQTREA